MLLHDLLATNPHILRLAHSHGIVPHLRTHATLEGLLSMLQSSSRHYLRGCPAAALLRRERCSGWRVWMLNKQRLTTNYHLYRYGFNSRMYLRRLKSCMINYIYIDGILCKNDMYFVLQKGLVAVI